MGTCAAAFLLTIDPTGEPFRKRHHKLIARKESLASHSGKQEKL
jgi:hypothetical protein